jgi:hypothetical protein
MIRLLEFKLALIIYKKILSLCEVTINNNFANLYFNMSKRSAIFAVCSVLMGLLLFAIWSNIRVYGQQQSSPSSPPLPATKISAQLKAKMCEPSSPSLKAVNTTESRICGIPKTIKNTTTTTEATPLTSSVSSSTPQQTTIIKPTSVAGISTAPKQQQITNTTKNNTNASSRSTTNGVAGATLAPVSNPSNKSLTSTSPSSSAIAPQVKAVNEQQQPPAPSPVTPINGTDRQNDAFVATPPLTPPSGKLLYLGYRDGDKNNPTNDISDSKDKSRPDNKLSGIPSTSPTSGNDSTGKKKTKSDATTNDNIGSKETSSPHPHIKITAPDNDASSNKKKTSSSTTLDRADSASDDDNTKPPIYSTVGSDSDGSPTSKEKNISTKVDITPDNVDDSSKKKKSSHNTELPSYDTRSSTAKDDSSTRKEKKTTDISKSDRTYSASDDGEDSKDKKNKDSSKLDTTINNDDSKHISKSSHHIRSDNSDTQDSSSFILPFH